MQRFLNGHREAVGEHEILRQYRDRINYVVGARIKQLEKWDWQRDFVQYVFMSRLRGALRERMDEWARALQKGDREKIGNPVSRGRNRGGGGPWTQYWFCNSLFWRLDAYRLLRLRVCTEHVRQHYPGWNKDAWWRWIDTFQKLQREHELSAKPFRKLMHRKGKLVWEGTVGAIDLTKMLLQVDVSRCVQRVVELHAKLLKKIAD